ncbi:MAG: S8 family serine peptidase, partial [Geobacteraceae bacterium]|nr:S8 family serine peptidase [Geobacteraceae bacterium]
MGINLLHSDNMRKGFTVKTFYLALYLFLFLIGISPLSGYASVPGKPNPQKKSEKTTSLNLLEQKQRADSWKNAEVLPGIIVVKYKESSSQGTLQLSKPAGLKIKLDALGVTGEKGLYKRLSGSGMLTKKGQGLSRIRVLSYSSGKDPRIVAEELSKDENVEYAEPYFVRHLFYTPNDPTYSSSWWLQTIQAAQAWDVAKGDTAMIIGIIDTGVQWNHPDLAANIKHNWAEIPGNGIDDDQNGYIDDVVGWDFGSTSNYPTNDGLGDNDPDERTSIHGTHCAGIAAAATNNDAGVASIGFNSKILPVKATIDRDMNNGIYYGYEGILYAAERGAKIISCSWGGEGYSQSEQDIINYVTEVKGSLIVAAAGNNNGRDIDKIPVYPAAYDNVLAVGAVDQYDVKAGFSNFGATACDIMAPGVAILSTWRLDLYAYLSGTSMACPMVAGSAALVAAKFPSYTPEQIAEQLRTTADNIDAQNPGYAGKLGKGRLNVYKALTLSNAVAIRLSNVELTDIDGDGYLAAGDTVNAKLTIRNVLMPVSGISVMVTPQSAHVSMLQSSFTLSSLGTLADYTDQSIRFVVDGDVALDETIEFNVEIATGGGYTGNEQFSATVQSSYLNLSSAGSNIELTINNRGNIGFNDYPNNLQGVGLLYRNKQMLFEGALMIGTSATTIEDVARDGSAQSADFSAKVPVKKISETNSLLDVTTTFSDTPVSIAQRLGLEISEHVY